jgi:hypothetical protein
VLNLPPPVRKKKSQVARVLGVNSATCYRSVKLKFVVAWVKKDPAKITTSVHQSKFRISKEHGFVFPIDLD